MSTYIYSIVVAMLVGLQSCVATRTHQLGTDRECTVTELLTQSSILAVTTHTHMYVCFNIQLSAVCISVYTHACACMRVCVVSHTMSAADRSLSLERLLFHSSTE